MHTWMNALTDQIVCCHCGVCTNESVGMTICPNTVDDDIEHEEAMFRILTAMEGINEVSDGKRDG